MSYGRKLLMIATSSALVMSAMSASIVAAQSPEASPIPGASQSPEASQIPAASPGKAWNLTLIQGVKGDPFYVTMACGAQAEATALGVNLTVTGGDSWDATVQTPVVDAVTAAHPDGVMIAPNDSKAMFAPLKRLTDAGIKLTLVDTSLEDTSIAVANITSNNELGGTTAATTLASLIGDTGSVLVVNVDPGITTTDARVKGFTDEITANHPNITLLPVQYTHDDPTAATSITTSTLAANSDLAGIFATNVINAEGVATALRTAGNTTVKVIAYDAGPKQQEDLTNGIVQGLVAQDPYTEGVDAVQQTVNALDGAPVTANIETELAGVTAANITDPAIAKFLYKSAC
jgi:ribose transport system substrate-binding protein